MKNGSTYVQHSSFNRSIVQSQVNQSIYKQYNIVRSIVQLFNRLITSESVNIQKVQHSSFNHSIVQSHVNQSIYKQYNIVRSIIQSFNHSIIQSQVKQSIYKKYNIVRSIIQSFNHSIIQSFNHSITRESVEMYFTLGKHIGHPTKSTRGTSTYMSGSSSMVSRMYISTASNDFSPEEHNHCTITVQ
jgi:hypothetical protein